MSPVGPRRSLRNSTRRPSEPVVVAAVSPCAAVAAVPTEAGDVDDFASEFSCPST